MFLAARKDSGERRNSSRFFVQWLTTVFIFIQVIPTTKMIKLRHYFCFRLFQTLAPLFANPVTAAMLFF